MKNSVYKQIIGIRTGLPLPSGWEMLCQLLVYFLVEDYTNYWIHRFLHNKWGYEKIHRVHHEYTAPIGFAAPYAHWAEILILGIPSFLGPAMVPGHMVTFWSWIALRQVEAIETHSGYVYFPHSNMVALQIETWERADTQKIPLPEVIVLLVSDFSCMWWVACNVESYSDYRK
ncbi:sterol-4alpha-methyl oxidase 1-1 [Prunus dulcis]|uniref:Sterol-4alpha-methyl oxidase 1-1 n=1 Tax=Prunus dulcis TaxID=3755 RepID=A0A4Y1RG14_PRUDU|nr:sterol-4alpha-methyl oxidase 1-1 [Prunus dulcis]